ncbi:AfsR/SARP family transcriptional regulator [Streptomyces sp. B-S-A8]|uniref:AfsR/SARP family transcriptional regulator n=1 Tax=Streptomyces solicavernae TaxID=3043614 RepID=A0ABT6S1N5_9ACTN|nr:AfsR/SARP family transcriptional regulator [Streptomyces sp. B-S-A8]MDI3390597.1 AfsR/SARP family transcriptional regulator [Streptomyces sp. B-S-A8]
MKTQVLGALRAEVNGESIVPTAGKPRQVLSLLSLYPGRALPVSTLMEELWGSEPPQSALTTLQTYILQLRRRLGSAMGPDSPCTAKDVLTTRHGGYLLRIPAEGVDVHQYEHLVTQGQAAADTGDDATAADRFRQALALWRGPALVDVQVGPVLEIEVLRLEESRLGTVEWRIDAELRLGRHCELIPELTELTARYAEHEGLHSQVMVALYRAGRQASALEVYRRLRTRLIDGLGVEPSPQVQRLHQAMLAVDPKLDILAGPRRSSTFDLYASEPAPSPGAAVLRARGGVEPHPVPYRVAPPTLR